MAVKIRLQRHGARHRPFYRIVVADSRSRRDGRFVEIVGTYDPQNKSENKQLNLKLDRAQYWLGVGAQPSDTARTLINRYKRENQDQVKALEEGRPLPQKEEEETKGKATVEDVVGDREAKPSGSAAKSVGEGDAAASAADPSAEAAEQEAEEVANKAADQAPEGKPVAGGTSENQGGKAPFEGAKKATGEEPPPAWEAEEGEKKE